MRRTFEPEGNQFIDRSTGRMVRQVTSAEAIHHHPFFLIPAYDNDGRWLFFVSHRLGAPQVFVEERASGRLVQVSDVPDLIEWSVHPSLDGRFVYFTSRTAGWRTELSTMHTEQIMDFGDFAVTTGGMVAGGMGTTALSSCGSLWALQLSGPDGTRIVGVDPATGRHWTITEHDAVAHMQVCPDDPSLLFFAGNFKQRIWTVNTDGTDKQQHYQRRPGEWITHESWIPGTREICMVNWPREIQAVAIPSGRVRTIIQFNAWHVIADPSGVEMVADTKNPDRGIVRFPTDGSGDCVHVCESDSSNAGDHWNGPFPYESGPIKVYAPQHTHPHPRFSPDREFVVFTSDRTGCAQLYEVAL